MPETDLQRQFLGLVWMPKNSRMRGHRDTSGFLYAIGGRNEEHPLLATVECIKTGHHDLHSDGKVTFLSNAWYSVSPMIQSRRNFGAAAHGPRSIIVAGGAPNTLSQSNTVEMFLRLEENGDGQWTRLAPLTSSTHAFKLIPFKEGYMSIGTFFVQLTLILCLKAQRLPYMVVLALITHVARPG